MTKPERLYGELKRNKWIRYFAIFCRIALALGFIPSGIVKVTGERFTALPSNHPLGHYFDALHLTGFYYTFIGVGQLVTALLLLIPRTALLGAMLYFPVILNICVLTYAVRFEGTRIATLMLLANLFLLVWDYDRLQHVLPFGPADKNHHVLDKARKFPVLFFAFVFAVASSVIVINHFLYDIRPGNSREECTNGCKNSGRPGCQQFCDCIYNQGKPLNACLAEYQKAKKQMQPIRKNDSLQAPCAGAIGRRPRQHGGGPNPLRRFSPPYQPSRSDPPLRDRWKEKPRESGSHA